MPEMKKIAIIDYEMGNLHSVQKAFEKVGADAYIASNPQELDHAEKIVLPGVGAFRDAISTLCEKRFVDPIKDFIKSERPFLGICLGLQMLFDIGYEDGQWDGMGIVPGKVVKFDFSDRSDQNELKIPHMGWNRLKIVPGNPLYAGLDDDSFVYFVHSYYVVPEDETVIATTTDHGIDFVSSIRKGNLFATQFHPEKSQAVGLKILENFAKL